MQSKLTGLIAATFTPMEADGALRLDQIEPLVERLLMDGVSGFYVCGTTGEGMSLTGAERRAVVEAHMAAVDGRAPVVVQVGHNSVAEACELAAHAEQSGAAAVSATAPSYVKVTTPAGLLGCMAPIAAAAPNLPFYYYHIPMLTGAAVDMGDFLGLAGDRIPNLRGIKFTSHQVFEFQHCLAMDGGRFDTLWGSDEMLLSALVVGARGAVGSTYNIAAPLYRRILAAFEAGDLEQARALQLLSVRMVRALVARGFHPMMKRLLHLLGLECEGARVPHAAGTDKQFAALRAELDEMGFFDWGRRPVA
jgi:N-acetylneuraminate lyase